MTKRSWIRNLFARPVTRRNKPRSTARTCRSERPALELLENRITPTQITVPVSGFNQDVIWAASESSAQAGTTAAYDAPNGWVMYEAGVPGESAGLPASGFFTSASNSFVNFQLASYTADNVLTLGYSEPATGTLTLATPSTFSSLNLLDSAVNGNAFFAFTLHFGDGSSTTVNNNIAPDWFFNTPYALNGFDRVGRSTGQFEGDTSDPRFYELDYRLSPADQVKQLDSITFTYQGAVNGNSGNGFGIFAVSGNNAPATPSTFVVNNPTDTPVAGKTDLRQAIALANSSAGDNTITFDPTVFKTPQTIALGGTQLELANLTGTETIVGPKAGVTVSGGGLSRVFQVDAGVTASFAGLTLSGGTTSGSGGGLFSSGTATLTGCTLSGDSATAFGGSGGGMFNSGTLTLTGCTLSGNSGPHYGHGAGLLNTGTAATATLTNCTVSSNTAPYGGGLWNNGTLALSGCTVSGNSSNFGGALDNFAKATFTNCTISGNSAGINGGGLDNLLFATATLTNCTVSGNSATNGGGLNNGFRGSMTVTGSNVKANTAVVGGGIANQATLSVASSNIINNTATSKGGGLSTTSGSATLANCVINSNQVVNPSGTALGGGIDCENSTLSLTSCTVNANQANGTTAPGGGAYALNSTVTVTSSTVNGNKANGSVLGEGGGIYSSHTALTLVGSIVKGNKASTDFDDLFNGP